MQRSTSLNLLYCLFHYYSLLFMPVSIEMDNNNSTWIRRRKNKHKQVTYECIFDHHRSSFTLAFSQHTCYCMHLFNVLTDSYRFWSNETNCFSTKWVFFCFFFCSLFSSFGCLFIHTLFFPLLFFFRFGYESDDEVKLGYYYDCDRTQKQQTSSLM